MATFTNQATLTYSNIIIRSNIVTGEIIPNEGEITAAKTAAFDRYNRNSTVIYTLRIENTTNEDIEGLTVTDNLGGYPFGTPEETVYPLEYIAGSVQYYINGELQDDPEVTVGPPLVIEGIDVPAGGNVLLIYAAAVTPFAPLDREGTITNEVAVTGEDPEDSITAEETIAAEIEADLTIGKSLSPATVSPGDDLTYTLVVLNSGNDEAEGDVVISDTFDPILTDISVRLNGALLTTGTDYTYDEATGEFATIEGRISVPAATFEQDENGIWITTPGSITLTITGTVTDEEV